ncbi:MAG: anaerobic ribonucleoside-triphosphate reductase [Kiritimatiellae bacterium]|nr:anaerobic ribonucleoside-triphosphate reductase [Kiritimatiellia bacterium]MBR2938978.1 anaerobic ribonucleoside-triphosphate reductase [Kiritimatiellia bacterium]
MRQFKIIKRSGEEKDFDITKIENAIRAASNTVDPVNALSEDRIRLIAKEVAGVCEARDRAMTVEEIQDVVENKIMEMGSHEIAKKYIVYRYKRELVRKANTTDSAIISLIECNNEDVKQENSNKNPRINAVQRDYMAGEVSKDVAARLLLPEDVVQAHKDGIIHFHDMDYYAQHMHNCDLVNLEDMLQNGTVISGTMIEKPKSFSTACNIATQIIAQVASNQYGGQSISLTHLAPFVDVSRQVIRAELKSECEIAGVEMEPEKFDAIVEKRVRKEIQKGVQTIQYQVVTLMTTNGQAPFVTVFMYLGEARSEQERRDLAMIIEEVLNERIRGVKNEEGVYITPAFPKLIYVLEPQNVEENSPYWYLTELAAKCTAKRMVPDYISEKKMREYKLSKGESVGNGDTYTCMGCRSFLTPDRSGNGYGNVANAGNYEPGKPKYYGRFNQGVVTINLVDVALSAGGSMDEFWRIFGDRCELCHRALRCRHERLKGTSSDAAPILWQYGALARLEKGEKIDKLLYGGYSTISLGYAGLWECVFAMTGKKLTEPEGESFGLEVMQKLNEYTAKWKAAEDIDYSLYGTPLESTTYKFAKCLQKRFGIVKGVTDRNYITNSYHIHVTEPIDAFRKLETEAKFQKLSPGGAISYVEVPNLQNNLGAVLAIMKFIYEHIMYAELNTKSDYCQVCGFDGEIEIVKDMSGKLIWRCPKCGNTDESKLNVARRTCGYIGSQFWNQGRTQEIKERVLHVS